MTEKIVGKHTEVPFAMQIADNPKVKGVISGLEAMKKAGAQTEFIVANMVQAAAMNCAVILRAGDPPQYDKERSPKSGLNLSKTSNQSFCKGAIPKEERFGRLDKAGRSIPHNHKDVEHLNLPPTESEYQHVMQLDINMQDILREIAPGGDLRVLGFNIDTGLLRFEYKEGRGPQQDVFTGQLVIDLYKGNVRPQFHSRDWNSPENDVNWDKEKKVIRKPQELSCVPDEVYQKVFNKTFYVAYTEEKKEIDNPESIKKMEVFANRPRSVDEFKKAMGENHPYFDKIDEGMSFIKMLNFFQTVLSEQEAYALILDVYNKSGKIVAGDWDGMALGYSPLLNKKFTEVINAFEPELPGLKNQKKLLMLVDEYLNVLKETAQDKIKKREMLKNIAKKDDLFSVFDEKILLIKQRLNVIIDFAMDRLGGIKPQMKTTAPDKIENDDPLSAFDEKILSIKYSIDIISNFALARAGCITPHEFLFQQVLNDAYRDETNKHYGEKYHLDVVQRSLNTLLNTPVAEENIHDVVQETLKREIQVSGVKVKEWMLHKMTEHLAKHLVLAQQNGHSAYVVPHMQYDMNVHDLYQHGFDMRNPYGCNLDGAWLLVIDGSVFYGETQEQLIEVMLTGDFLQRNCIDVNQEANFSAGWDRIIERQIALGHHIPEGTMKRYTDYLVASQSHKMNSLAEDTKGPEISSLPDNAEAMMNREKQLDIKKRYVELKKLGSKPEESIDQTEVISPRTKI